MYYPDLATLSCYKIMKHLIDELDTWLAALPSSIKDRITVENVSSTFDIPYDIAKNILDDACKIGVLDNIFAITCPNCEFTLKITDKKHLIDDISSITHCYECENEDIEITSDDVYTMYKLLQKPNRAYVIKQTTSQSTCNLSSNSSLSKIINNDPSQISSFFFAPDASDYATLKQLLTNLDADFPNTTAQGAALDQFISELFGIVPNFTTSTALRNSTNQIDCCVKNSCKISHSIFEVTGNFFVMECKNESKTPPNTYFRKLDSIMDTMGINFGIIVSRKKWASTCDQLAWQKHLQHGRIIINLCDTDFDLIVNQHHNLLDIIHNKCIVVITNSSKPLFS